MARLGDVFPLIRNGASIKQIDGAGGLPVTRIETIANRVVDRSRMGYANIIDKDRYTEYQLQDGDILMSHINSERHLGKVARYKSIANEYIIHGMNLLVLRVNRQIMMSEYAEYFFNSDSFLRQIPNITKKSVNQASFNISSLRELFIPIPQLDQQREVVYILDEVCALISLRKQQLAKLDELVKSRFIELFGDPLHPVHSRALGDVAVLERGRFSPRPRNDPRYYGGDYPFIQTGDIAGCGHRLSEYRQTLNEKGIHVSKKFSAGTIVIAIVGATIGATAILEIDVYAPDSVIGISVNDELYNNVFMEALLQFWQPELVRIAPESARANINLRILQSIPIIDVELPRQLQFASFVEQTDKSKLSIQQSIDQLETLKKSLMQKYFG